MAEAESKGSNRSCFRLRRSAFDESLVILERGAGAAAQALLDEVEGGEGIDSKRSPHIINAAKAVVDQGFRAQDAITVKEEMADLRAELASLKANQQQPGQKAPVPVPLPVPGPAVQDG